MSATPARHKVLLDTDMGGDIDDALCLSWLLMQPACDLMGITTVCGNPINRARIAAALCRVAGRDVPIRAGMDPKTPNGWYPTPEGESRLPYWPHPDNMAGGTVDFLYDTLRQHPGEVDILAIGSLSNIAALVAAHPDAPGLARSLWALAGLFDDALRDSPDMPYLNWNVWADPPAAQTVFRADFPEITLLGVGITRQLTVSDEAVRAKFAHPLLACALDFARDFLKTNVVTMHDPLGAVAMFYPEVCTYQRGLVDVDLQAQGRLHAVTRFSPDPDGRCRVAISVNRDAFFERFFAPFQ